MMDRSPVTSENDRPKSSSKVPTDEKLYLGFVALGLIVIATFFTITLVRGRRAEAARTQVPVRHLGEFALTNRNGALIRRTDLSGQWLVVNFVFTSCGISCLQVNRHMAEIQSRTTNRTDVRLVSLSVDPRSDTPASLARFADRFGADPARWLFLTGEKDVLYPLIENSFLGPTKSPPIEDQPAGMIHSDHIALMDGTGRLLRIFDGLKSSVVDEVIQALGSAPAVPRR